MTRPTCIVVCIVVLRSCSCCCRCCIVVFFSVLLFLFLLSLLLSVVCSRRLLLSRSFIVRRHPLVTVLPFLWLSRCIVVSHRFVLFHAVACCFALFRVVLHCCCCCCFTLLLVLFLSMRLLCALTSIIGEILPGRLGSASIVE